MVFAATAFVLTLGLLLGLGHLAGRYRAEAVRERARAHFWRRTFTEYLAFDIAHNESAKRRLAVSVQTIVDNFDAHDLARKKGWR